MALDTVNTDSLRGREIILAVCGGIAAYKSADLTSKLVQRGAGVTVVMSDDAQKFVTPLTFQALSGRPVRTGIYDLQDSSDPQHIALTERADLMLIAPATATVIGKIANGICDELIPLMVIAAACPVALAPAMNNRMWDHAAVKANVARLREMNYDFIGPADGWLACRNVGPGRLSEPSEIIEFVTKKFTADKFTADKSTAETQRAQSQ